MTAKDVLLLLLHRYQVKKHTQVRHFSSVSRILSSYMTIVFIEKVTKRRGEFSTGIIYPGSLAHHVGDVKQGEHVRVVLYRSAQEEAGWNLMADFF